jgi:hypothetical protein
MIERGLVIAGEVVAGTEWCVRDSSAWWAEGERGTRPRAPKTDVLVGHWTGGEASVRSVDDDGPFVVRGMKARVRPDGSPMDVAIHFVIGACSPDDPIAQVWQTADPGLVACVHVGKRWINARSIGVEVVSAGLPGSLDLRHRPTVHVALLGKMQKVLAFFPGQVRAWVRLADTLAALNGRGGIAIPARVPAFSAARRFSLAEARRWAGAMEHCSVPGGTKKDAGGLLIDALADVGWERAQP